MILACMFIKHHVVSALTVGAGEWRKGATGGHWAVYDYMRTLDLTVERGIRQSWVNSKVAKGPRPYSMSLSDI